MLRKIHPTSREGDSHTVVDWQLRSSTTDGRRMRNTTPAKRIQPQPTELLMLCCPAVVVQSETYDRRRRRQKTACSIQLFDFVLIEKQLSHTSPVAGARFGRQWSIANFIQFFKRRRAKQPNGQPEPVMRTTTDKDDGHDGGLRCCLGGIKPLVGVGKK